MKHTPPYLYFPRSAESESWPAWAVSLAVWLDLQSMSAQYSAHVQTTPVCLAVPHSLLPFPAEFGSDLRTCGRANKDRGNSFAQLPAGTVQRRGAFQRTAPS